MKLRIGISIIATRICDFIWAIFLGLYAFLIVGPLGFLRGPLVLERALWYLRVFIPMGLMTKAIRVAIDWRLGQFDAAIAQAEDMVSIVENDFLENSQSQVRRKVLADLYTILARAYMHTGHIDEAMHVILRAKKSLGTDRLVGLVELDAKTAHLVRAGLAAGRLLDGGGLATMFIKTDSKSDQFNNDQHKNHSSKQTKETDEKNNKQQSKDQGAKIIPFPHLDTLI